MVDLQRSVPFTVTDQPAEGGGMVYAINLQLPPAPGPSRPIPPLPGGSLAGKVVVVDPATATRTPAPSASASRRRT